MTKEARLWSLNNIVRFILMMNRQQPQFHAGCSCLAASLSHRAIRVKPRLIHQRPNPGQAPIKQASQIRHLN
ncbi:hypothetical protein [Undibacterium sp.]|uniref:hypothetical protein n=1 Tax=Undibacterium sp. TaxID=1914977 RepID=UPI002C5A0F86|nr:hypothetical protein [Undibacterium sp.]HTD06713.1 hypothetical protein [Undibacterium sp.]